MVAMHDGDAPSQPNWHRRITIGIVAAVGAVLLYSHRRGGDPAMVGPARRQRRRRQPHVGALYGLFIGFVFTVAPLLLLLAVVRWRTRRRTWLGWLGWLACSSLLLAAPNLMTLGIVLGISDAAHAGDRILDVEGPGFRLWTLIGVIVGVARRARQRSTSSGRGDRRDGEPTTCVTSCAAATRAEPRAAAPTVGRPWVPG